MAKPSSFQNTHFTLTASSPLDGYSAIINGAALVEITAALSIVSVAPFTNDGTSFKTSIAKLFSSDLPNATTAYEQPGKKVCLFLPSAHGQWFLCFDNDGADPIYKAKNLLGKRLSNRIAMTEQSDSWVVLALYGPLVRHTLERICPIDCSATAMPVGTTVRTVIEHLGTIILRRPDDSNGNPCFWLLSARSSAASFLSTITASPPFTPS